MSEGPAVEVGRVEQLRVYPVKSLAGGRVASTTVGPTGLLGDRGWAVVDEDGQRVTARRAPRLREAAAELDGSGRPAVHVGPDAPATGSAAESALGALVGRPVRLAAAAGGASHVDVAPVHLVSRAALVAAAGDDHSAHEDGCPCSSEDPRANVVLALDLPGGADETTLVGARLALGGAVLRVTRRPKHCLGVYADVVAPGPVAEGDVVRLLDDGQRAGAVGGSD